MILLNYKQVYLNWWVLPSCLRQIVCQWQGLVTNLKLAQNQPKNVETTNDLKMILKNQATQAQVCLLLRGSQDTTKMMA